MSKSAFSLLELVFVIAVVGILSAAIIPRFERETLYEAAEQLLSHIRLTQHMALMDDVYQHGEPSWAQAMWRISFRDCTDGGKYYVVFSDKDLFGDADFNERAIDPLTHKQLYATNNCAENSDYLHDVILSDAYGIDDVVLTGSCFTTNKYMAFDHLGRPHYDLTTTTHLADSTCRITLVSGDSNLSILIEPETGYSRITS